MGMRAGIHLVSALMMALAMHVAHAAEDMEAAARTPAQAVEDRLSALVTPRVQNEVMVLGSWHLAAFRDWLEPMLSVRLVQPRDYLE